MSSQQRQNQQQTSNQQQTQNQTTNQQQNQQQQGGFSNTGMTFGSSGSTQGFQRDPFAPVIPGLTNAARGINDWMTSAGAAEAYGGPRVAQMSDATRKGLEGFNSATGANQSMDMLRGTIGGQFLGPNNPYLTQVQNAARAAVMPSINSRVSASGMAPGSSVDQALVSREMTNAMANPLMQSYEAERGRQMQAAGMLPGMEQQVNAGRVAAGQLGEGYQQRNYDAARQQFEEQRIAGLRPFQEATGLLTGIGAAGGSGSQTQGGWQAGGGTQSGSSSASSSGQSQGQSQGSSQSQGTTNTNTTMQNQPSWLQTGLGIGMMGAGLLGGGGPLAGMMGGMGGMGGLLGGLGGMFGGGNGSMYDSSMPGALGSAGSGVSMGAPSMSGGSSVSMPAQLPQLGGGIRSAVMPPLEMEYGGRGG